MPKRERSIPRRLQLRHLPLTIHRRVWAQIITLLLVGPIGTLPAMLVFAGIETRANPIALLLILLCSAVFLLAAVIGLDRSIGYRLMIDADGFTTQGLLFTRQFRWNEVR